MIGTQWQRAKSQDIAGARKLFIERQRIATQVTENKGGTGRRRLFQRQYQPVEQQEKRSEQGQIPTEESDHKLKPDADESRFQTNASAIFAQRQGDEGEHHDAGNTLKEKGQLLLRFDAGFGRICGSESHRPGCVINPKLSGFPPRRK